MEIIAVLYEGVLHFYTKEGNEITVNVFDYEAVEGMSEEYISQYDGVDVVAYTTKAEPLNEVKFNKMVLHIKEKA